MQETAAARNQATSRKRPDVPSKQFVPLHAVDNPTVDTLAAAYYLNRKPQTLRDWSARDDGPLRPIRVFGRLAWPVAEIRRLLGVPAYGKATPSKGA